MFPRFLFQFLQVLVIQTVGKRDVDVIPSVVARLVAADQQNSRAPV
jgi:hypothetical protein